MVVRRNFVRISALANLIETFLLTLRAACGSTSAGTGEGPGVG